MTKLATDKLGRDYDPEHRKLVTSIGGLKLHASRDSKTIAAHARKSGPSTLAWHYKTVDPDLTLEEVERDKRAERARKAYFKGLRAKQMKRAAS